MATLDAIGLVVADIARSVDFYVLLGVPRPTDMEGPHVESVLPNGIRLMWDSIELVHQLDPNWKKPDGQQIGLAFLCDSPADVDATHQKLVVAGFESSSSWRA